MNPNRKTHIIHGAELLCGAHQLIDSPRIHFLSLINSDALHEIPVRFCKKCKAKYNKIIKRRML